MNRVDRLMGIVVRLQSRRVVRAEDIAEYFEISLRTVYRDMAALGEAGIPILAEPGVGYSIVFVAESFVKMYRFGQIARERITLVDQLPPLADKEEAASTAVLRPAPVLAR